MPQRPVTRSRSQASASVPVRPSQHEFTFAVSFKPSRLPKFRNGVKQPVKWALHLPTRILAPSPRLPPSPTTGSSSGHNRAANVLKRPRSPDDHVVASKLVRSQMPELPTADAPRHASLVGDMSLVAVLSQQGRVPTSRPLPLPPDLDS